MFNVMNFGTKISEISAFLKSDNFKDAANTLAGILDSIGFTHEADLMRIEASDVNVFVKLKTVLDFLTDILEHVLGKPPMVATGNDALCCKLDYFAAACMVSSDAAPVPAGMSPVLLEALITIGVQLLLQIFKNRHK